MKFLPVASHASTTVESTQGALVFTHVCDAEEPSHESGVKQPPSKSNSF